MVVDSDAGESGRPRVVSVAGLLLLMLPIVGVIGVVTAVIALSGAQDSSGELIGELAGQGIPDGQRIVDDMISGMWLQLGGQSVVRLLQAVAMGVLAYFVLRGSRGARIAVFVLAGLSVLAVGCLGVLLTVLRELRGNLDRLSQRAGFRMVDETDLLPGWFNPVNYALVGVSVGMILAAVVLLTRPAANAYFNRGRPVQPPIPAGPPIVGPPAPVPAAPAAPAGSGVPVATGFPPGFVRRASIVLAAFVVIVLAGGFFALRNAGDTPRMPGALPGLPSMPPDRAHQVLYVVEIQGLSKSGSISYSTPGGASTEPIPANLPAYSGGAAFPSSRFITVMLNASAQPPDEYPASAIFPRMRCSIHVDGVVSATNTGRGFCMVMFRLDEFTGVPVTPTASAAPKPKRSSANPDCGYLTADEVADVLAKSAGQKRRLPAVDDISAGHCDYRYGGNDYVQVSWRAGSRLTPAGSEQIVETAGVPAIWDSTNKGMKFELPTGVLWVQANLRVTDEVGRRIVTELFTLARTRVR